MRRGALAALYRFSLLKNRPDRKNKKISPDKNVIKLVESLGKISVQPKEYKHKHINHEIDKIVYGLAILFNDNLIL